MATSVTQYGITWTFDSDYTVGQFVNGDYYVVGPLTINSVSPAPVLENGHNINGSMINPVVGDDGYDSRTVTYNALLSVSYPLVVSAATSLVSTISVVSTEDTPRPCLTDAAVLTVLLAEPPANSFRPPIIGTTKTLYNYGDINWSLLPDLATTPSIPTVTEIQDDYMSKIIRPRILHVYNWQAWYTNPINNYDGYHRNNGLNLSHCAVLCLLNWGTQEQKRELVMYYIQVAIDYYAMQVDSASTSNEGALATYRWITVFGGLMLGDNDMRDLWLSGTTWGTPAYDDDKIYLYADRRRTIDSLIIPLGETWTGKTIFWRVANNVGAGDNDTDHEHLHPTEWPLVEGFITDPSNDGYKQEEYRLMHSSQIVGFALCSIIMRAHSYYNFDVTVTYMDRYMNETLQELEDAGDLDPHSGYLPQTSTVDFVDESWVTYRDAYGIKYMAFTI